MTQEQTWTPGPSTPQNQRPQKKKSHKGLIIGGCGGCLGMILTVCVCSGWIGYLEEGVPYSDPGEELTSVPFASGEPIAFDATWDGTGYATLRAYVDLGEDVPIGATVTGTFGCEQVAGYQVLAQESIDASYRGGGGPEGWVRLSSFYMYRRGSRSPFHCEGVLNLPPGLTSARLIITTRQRPSDWISGL